MPSCWSHAAVSTSGVNSRVLVQDGRLLPVALPLLLQRHRALARALLQAGA